MYNKQVNKYPKLTLLCISFVLAYLLYHIGVFDWLTQVTNGHGYVSVFIGGLLFSFGFTSAFGIAIFVQVAGEVNPFIAAPIAGLGAFLSDFLIFELLRFSAFHDELHRLRSSRLFKNVHALFHHDHLSERVRKYLLWSFAGIVIASPLPDEFGVSLVSGISDIKPRDFAILCFVCNTVGVFAMLVLARAVAS